LGSFCATLLTGRQTDKQTNKQRRLYNSLAEVMKNKTTKTVLENTQTQS